MRKLIVLWSLLLIANLLHAAAPKLPPEKELKTLVLDSLSAFNKAVQQKDFSQFHKERLSPQLREQVPLDKFSKSFQVFIDQKHDISDIAKSDPVFDEPPKIDDEGVLILKGHYDIRPNNVTFSLKYISESASWKILGINIEAGPTREPAAEVPPDKNLKKLVLDSLLSFDQAVRTKDFNKFHGEISKTWQQQISPDDLLKTFKSFVDQKAHIAGIADVDPEFTKPPAVDEEGRLIVAGSYPTQPKTVFFQLKYLTESGKWKLIGLNVRLDDSEKAEKKTSDEEDDDGSDDEGWDKD